MAHLAFWCLALLVTPPLPGRYLSDRKPEFTRTEHGIQFDLVHDANPLVVLAERPFGEPFVADGNLIWAALVLNLPAVLAAIASTSGFESSLGFRAATWVGTGTFAVVSTLQWLGIGWIGSVLRKRLSLR